MKRLPRSLRWVIGIGGTLIVLVAALVFVVRSDAFTRFLTRTASAQVPGLDIRDVQGSFATGVAFALVYETEGLTVEAVDAQLQLGVECLWRLKLCVRSLSLAELYVQLAPTPAQDNGDASAIELPTIELPVDLHVDQLSIAHIDVQQAQESLYTLDDVHAALAWSGERLQIGQLRGRDAYCYWQLAGHIALNGDYPLSMEVDCDSQMDLGRFRADLGGTVAELEARVLATTTALPVDQPVAFIAKGFLAPLQPDLPLEVRLELQEPVRINQGELQLTLSAAQLDVNGPLLEPQLDLVAVAQTNQWQGDNRLEVSARASTEQLVVQTLNLQLPRGEVNGEGTLDYAQAIAWQGELSWRNLDGRLWRDDLAVQLSGNAAQMVRWENESLSASVNLRDFSGTLFDKPLQGSGRFDYQNAQLAIDEFQLRQGQNRLRADGSLAPQAQQQLQIEFNAPALASLWPDLQGAAEGTVQLRGALDNLAVDVDVRGTNFVYTDIRVGSAMIDVTWHQDLNTGNRVQVEASDIVVAAAPAAGVTLDWRGTFASHRLQLDLHGMDEQADKALALRCSGGFADSETAPNFEHWSGACERLAVDYQLAETAHHWENDAPIKIDAQPLAASFSIAEFCLVNLPARVCSLESIQYRDNALANLELRGDAMPIVWVKPWLPEGTNLEGGWQFDLSAANLAQNPNLNLAVSSDQLLAQWRTADGEAVQLHITNTQLNWTWQDTIQRLNWEVDSAQNGAVRGQLSITQENENRQTLDGELVIDQLQLLTFSRLVFTDVADSFSGVVNGQLQVSGSLDQPLVNGKVQLDNGRVVAGVLPVPVRDIHLTANVERNLAMIEGRFRAAEGEGSVSGRFNWRDSPWSASLSLQADQLVLQPQKDIRVTLSPDVELKATPERLTLSGEVRVPKADIELEELPAQAVSVSSDAVVVGGGPQVETDTGLQVQSDLNLVLGDEVHFKGFGLETRITGSLNIRQTGGELTQGKGVLQLKQGRYKAYGQSLEITNGDLVFVESIENPQLRLEAIRLHTTNNVVVGLRATGPARSPRISLFSDPSMPEQEQLHYLVYGTPPGTASRFNAEQAAAQAALSYALESETGTSVTRRAGQALGIEDLKVTTNGGDEGTQIGLSGYLSPNLMVSYGVGVFDAVNSLTMQYRLTKNIYLEVVSGETKSLELLWSFEKD